MRLPRIVLTPEEKSALIFVLLAFTLGLATKHYRDRHPHVSHSAAPSPQKARQSPTPSSDESD